MYTLLLIEVVEQGRQTSLRHHVALRLKLRHEASKHTTWRRTLSRALKVLSRSGSGKHALRASRAL